MATLNPYLTFNGNCEEAFAFYHSVFGGQFGHVGRYGEMPTQEGRPPLPATQVQKIMHMSLPLENGSVLMGCDSFEDWGHVTVMGNNVTISIQAQTKAEADSLYNGLSEGGNQTMPMNKTFWGSYFGMLTDKFGIHWMVSFEETSQ